MYPLTLDKTVMAPCGMNCGICRAYLREKDLWFSKMKNGFVKNVGVLLV